MKLAIGLGAIALMGCTASAEMRAPDTRGDRELAAALAGRTAGTPTDCIGSTGLGGPEVIDGHTILYRETGRVVWRNDLPTIAPGSRR
ncbi:MAG: hypothetical protein WDN44_14340 [Sphingomonas sp.]